MLTLQNAQDIIAREIEQIEYSESPAALYDPMQYILGLGGKRIRPALTLLGCNLFSDNYENAIPAAIALEVFHNFTLVHDDIMDNANLRRGKETIHLKWGNNTAILSGDAMCIKAYEFLSQTKREYLPEVFKVFNTIALQVCEGQQYDMDFEKIDHVSEAQYLKMIELKTSVLLGACVKIGAITGGASTDNADLMYQFGRNMGLAFQLQDDLLDAYADASVFGKEIGKDIVSNKKTFLLIKALELAKAENAQKLTYWLNVSQFDRNEKIAGVISVYNALDISNITNIAIEKYLALALNSIQQVEVDSAKKETLLNFCKSLTDRKF